MRRLAAATMALALSACTAIIGGREQPAQIADLSAEPDLAGADLSGADLTGGGTLDFAGADLTGVLGLPSQSDSSLSVAPASVPADGSSNGLITVLIKDAMGNAVVGQPVSLTASGTTGVITPTSGITNGLGVFNATITSTKAEMKTVTATVFGFTLDGAVTFTAGSASLGSSSLDASPATITADNSSSTTLTVTVRDGNNNPVAGKNVSFAVDGSGNTLTPAGSATDASGKLTATLKTTKAEMKTVSATVGTFMLAQGVTATAGLPDAALSTLTASPTSNLPANGSASSTLTATLRDAFSNLVTGTAVTFASGAGTGFSANNVATDGSGVATTKLTATTAGAKSVTATAAGVLVTQSPTVTFSGCTVPTALTTSPQAGDTTGGSNLYHPACATAPDANERVYSFSIGATAQSAILDRGASFAGAVTDIRPAVTGCSTDAQSQVCTSDRYVYCPSLPANASYQVVVDGSNSAVGTYAIDVVTAAAKGANSYGLVTTPATFSSIAGLGTKVIANTVTVDGTAASQLPFAFKYFGTNKVATTPLTIFQSGYLAFAATPNTRQNVCPIPSASLPAETIAPFWSRLGARSASRGEVWILTQGVAPNRTFTVEWNQMDAYTNAVDGMGNPTTYECVKLSFQAILYETSNLIEFRYDPINEDTCGKNTTTDIGYAVGGHSTIGIQGANAGVLVQSASCNAADGTGPQVVGTIADAGTGFPDVCTATKGYLFLPPTAGCP